MLRETESENGCRGGDGVYITSHFRSRIRRVGGSLKERSRRDLAADSASFSRRQHKEFWNFVFIPSLRPSPPEQKVSLVLYLDLHGGALTLADVRQNRA